MDDRHLDDLEAEIIAERQEFLRSILKTLAEQHPSNEPSEKPQED